MKKLKSRQIIQGLILRSVSLIPEQIEIAERILRVYGKDDNPVSLQESLTLDLTERLHIGLHELYKHESPRLRKLYLSSLNIVLEDKLSEESKLSQSHEQYKERYGSIWVADKLEVLNGGYWLPQRNAIDTGDNIHSRRNLCFTWTIKDLDYPVPEDVSLSGDKYKVKLLIDYTNLNK